MAERRNLGTFQKVKQDKEFRPGRDLRNFLFSGRKEIQRQYTFWVDFFDPREGSRGENKMPLVQNWHVRNINIPSYGFRKEVLQQGILPRTFPVFQSEGFEVTIEFEEDNSGTIANFINWLQNLVVRNDGVYIPPDLNRLRMVLYVRDFNMNPAVQFTFDNVYYLKANDITYDYGANDTVKYAITFNSDYYDLEFFKELKTNRHLNIGV